MGIKNYLIEGVSGTGKTSVCNELQRRGYHAIHGDRELAYRGDPETGEPRDGSGHEHHIWNVDKVKALVANQDEPKEDVPKIGISIDATAPITHVVDEILRHSEVEA